MTAEEAKRRILARAAGEVGTREAGENITKYASAYGAEYVMIKGK